MFIRSVFTPLPPLPPHGRSIVNIRLHERWDEDERRCFLVRSTFCFSSLLRSSRSANQSAPSPRRGRDRPIPHSEFAKIIRRRATSRCQVCGTRPTRTCPGRRQRAQLLPQKRYLYREQSLLIEVFLFISLRERSRDGCVMVPFGCCCCCCCVLLLLLLLCPVVVVSGCCCVRWLLCPVVVVSGGCCVWLLLFLVVVHGCCVWLCFWLCV